MTEPYEWLAPVMFLFVLVFIFSGFPVAFALGGTSLLFAVLAIFCGILDWHFLLAMPERIFGFMSNYTLLAIPFFVFMGTMLEKSRIAEDLLKTIGQLFGPVRGGLALAVVLVGTLLAAATGVIGASVVAMGMISLPVMLRYGYAKPLAAGVIAASGTLGQIIPPSIVLVVLGDQLGVSIGDLFIGSLVPGLMLAGLYAVYVFTFSLVRPASAPALPVAEHLNFSRSTLARVVKVMIPPLALILLVLGSIFFGVATATEAGALGAMGAMVLALLHGRLTVAGVRDTSQSTLRLTSMIMMLLVGSAAFSLIFRGLNGDVWIEDMLVQLPGGLIGFLILVNLMIFILGFFIDFFEITFIILPLLLPAARALGIDPVWFGVMIGVNLQTSFLTPPFGFALFYLRGVAPPELKTRDIYLGVLPFIGLQALMLIILVVFPEVVIRLPSP